MNLAELVCSGGIDSIKVSNDKKLIQVREKNGKRTNYKLSYFKSVVAKFDMEFLEKYYPKFFSCERVAELNDEYFVADCLGTKSRELYRLRELLIRRTMECLS